MGAGACGASARPSSARPRPWRVDCWTRVGLALSSTNSLASGTVGNVHFDDEEREGVPEAVAALLGQQMTLGQLIGSMQLHEPFFDDAYFDSIYAANTVLVTTP